MKFRRPPTIVQRTEQTQWLQLIAGADNKGMPVLEKVEAFVLEPEGHFELVRSPLFVRNLAAGDIFQYSELRPGVFTLVRRSGNLAIRVFGREELALLAQDLTPEVEKLEGSLDLENPRALVYSLHVNIGFGPIESLFDGAMARYPGTVWYYGNIYDPLDGVTPLHWWDEFLNQI